MSNEKDVNIHLGARALSAVCWTSVMVLIWLFILEKVTFNAVNMTFLVFFLFAALFSSAIKEERKK